jgi:hypothetical protein
MAFRQLLEYLDWQLLFNRHYGKLILYLTALQQMDNLKSTRQKKYKRRFRRNE